MFRRKLHWNRIHVQLNITHFCLLRAHTQLLYVVDLFAHQDGIVLAPQQKMIIAGKVGHNCVLALVAKCICTHRVKPKQHVWTHMCNLPHRNSRTWLILTNPCCWPIYFNAWWQPAHAVNGQQAHIWVVAGRLEDEERTKPGCSSAAIKESGFNKGLINIRTRNFVAPHLSFLRKFEEHYPNWSQMC